MNEHPRAPGDSRDEIELFLRDAYAAGANAAHSRSLLTAMEYAEREAPKLRALLTLPEGRCTVVKLEGHPDKPVSARCILCGCQDLSGPQPDMEPK